MTMFSEGSKARLYLMYKELTDQTARLLVLSIIETRMTMSQLQQDEIINAVEELINNQVGIKADAIKRTT